MVPLGRLLYEVCPNSTTSPIRFHNRDGINRNRAAVLIVKEHWFLWFYAWWKVVTAIVIVVLGCIPTVFLGWDTMLPSGKLVAVGGLVLSAWKAVDLVFDKMAARITEGKSPMAIPGQNGVRGDMEQIQKPAESGK